MTLSPESEPAAASEVRDATCLACGCLCDDIGLTVRAGRVVEARNACEIGRGWFLTDPARMGVEPATIEGAPVPADQAVERAAALLGSARAPLVVGLTQTSTETVAEALALAERIGAVVDLDVSDRSSPQLQAFQRVGRVSATLGEVKNRADVVVFWGADPVVTHPRHWERYSVAPRGRFAPRGRGDRTVIVVDSAPSATSERADLFLRIARERWFETLWTLRALLRGVALDPDRIERATSLPLETLAGLAASLRRAHYGAWFYGLDCARSRGGAALIEAAPALVRDLNAHTRFVILPLGGPGNATGADAVMTWRTGHSGRVDLGGGPGRLEPAGGSANDLLERGLADAALIVADDVRAALSESARAQLARVPTVLIAPRATEAGIPATVAFDSATCGIDAGGTVMRADGVMLPLRPPLRAALPTDREWLRALSARLGGKDHRP